VVRSLVEGWNRGDRDDMSAFHPDVRVGCRFGPLQRVRITGSRASSGLSDTEELPTKFELRQNC